MCIAEFIKVKWICVIDERYIFSRKAWWIVTWKADRNQSIILTVRCTHLSVQLIQNTYIMNTFFSEHFFDGSVDVHHREILLYHKLYYIENTLIIKWYRIRYDASQLCDNQKSIIDFLTNNFISMRTKQTKNLFFFLSK
jgi:hypothetical protein